MTDYLKSVKFNYLLHIRVPRKMILRIFLLLFICIPFHGYAEVYKWVDEHGQTHYEEQPSAANATEVKIQDIPQSDMSLQKRNEESDKLLKVYEEERNIKNEEKQKAEEEEKKQAKKCMTVENELKDMQQGGTLYYNIDDKGERKYLSDMELTQRIKELQEQYNLHCK